MTTNWDNTITKMADEVGGTIKVTDWTPLYPKGSDRLGWHIRLPNNIVVSVQRSPWNYCDENTAEIAAWFVDGRTDRHWVWDEQVRGYQTAKEVEAAIAVLARRDD